MVRHMRETKLGELELQKATLRVWFGEFTFTFRFKCISLGDVEVFFLLITMNRPEYTREHQWLMLDGNVVSPTVIPSPGSWRQSVTIRPTVNSSIKSTVRFTVEMILAKLAVEVSVFLISSGVTQTKS